MIIMALTIVATPLFAEVNIGPTSGIGLGVEVALCTNLDSNVTILNDGSDFASPAGSFTVPMSATASFNVTLSSVSDWDDAVASASGDINAYLSTRTAGGIDGNSSGWGVEGGASDNDFDAAGEAMLFTFDLSNLSSNHQESFELTGFRFNKNDAGELYSMAVVDNSENELRSVVTNQDVTVNVSGLSIEISDGDTLVLGYNGGGAFRWGRLDLDNAYVEPVPTAPTNVIAVGGNESVELSWTAAEETGLSSYRIDRSITSGSGYTTITNIGATSFTDLGLLNDQTYYYVVTAVYASTNLSAAEVSATPSLSFIATGQILDEDFTTAEGYVAGDLAGQTNWVGISGTGTNAFEVDPAGAGFADTEVTTNSWDTTNGNAVVWITGTENGILDSWTGHVDFQLNAETAPGLAPVTNEWVSGGVTNNDVYEIGDSKNLRHVFFDVGLTPSTTEALDFVDTDKVLLQLKSRDEFELAVHLMADNTDREIARLTPDAMGWDPSWIYAATNAASAPDFTSDPIRLTYTIQKTKFDGYYLADASLSNLVSGAYTTNGLSKTFALQEAYDSSVMYFAMDKAKSADATDDPDDIAEVSEVNINLDSVSLLHTSNATEIVLVPEWKNTAIVANDEQLSLFWKENNYLEDAYSYNVLRATVDGGPYTQVANVDTNTYIDTAVNNLWTYYYVLQAVSDSVQSDNSAQEEGFPVKNSTPLTMGEEFTPEWTSKDDANSTVLSSTAGDTIGAFQWVEYLTNAMLEAGGGVQPDYLENTLYGISQFASNDHARCRISGKDDPHNLEFKFNGDPMVVSNAFLWYVNTVDFDDSAYTNALDLTAEAYRFRMRVGELTVSSNTLGGVHVAVRQDDTWYVSYEGFTTNNSNLILEDMGHATNTWSILDTTQSANVMSVADVPNLSVTLTNVDAVGWFISNIQSLQIETVSINVVDLQGATGYDFWLADHLLESPDGDSDADPDLDGFINLLEYGLNGDPNDSGNTGVSPEMAQVDIGGTNYLQYVHVRRTGDDLGIDYNLKETEDLVYIPMTNDVVVAFEYAGPYTNDYESVTNLIPITADNKFIRLEIEEL